MAATISAATIGPRGLIPPLVFTRCVLPRMYGYQESRNARGKNRISARRSTMSCSAAYATPRLCLFVHPGCIAGLSETDRLPGSGGTCAPLPYVSFEWGIRTHSSGEALVAGDRRRRPIRRMNQDYCFSLPAKQPDQNE